MDNISDTYDPGILSHLRESRAGASLMARHLNNCALAKQPGIFSRLLFFLRLFLFPSPSPPPPPLSTLSSRSCTYVSPRSFLRTVALVAKEKSRRISAMRNRILLFLSLSFRFRETLGNSVAFISSDIYGAKIAS